MRRIAPGLTVQHGGLIGNGSPPDGKQKAGPHSLYIHIPFCHHRCAYCDFNTYAGKQDLIPEYVEALRREMEFVGGNAPPGLTIHTVFFGGGTPSLLASSQLGDILRTMRKCFDIAEAAEITIEANPGTVTLDGLFELRAVGINRISFGAQSANGEELRLLEREHDFLAVIEAVAAARKAGFDNLNLDLIFGLPEQSLRTWQTTVKRVLDLHPDHLSAYALTLESGTPFGHWTARGLMPVPNPDLAADMYEWAGPTLELAGFSQYEISNWSQAGRECKHNLQYWRGLPYLGLGAGAHGFAGGLRYSNVLRIKTYIERLTAPEGHGGALAFPLGPAAVNHHKQSLADGMSEAMLMGLRLTREGVRSHAFSSEFGVELRDAYGAQIRELQRLGVLEWAENKTSEVAETSEVLRLTPRGRLLANQAFLRFLP